MIEDSYKRLEELADSLEPKFRSRFKQILRDIKSEISLATIEQLITYGRIEDALALAEGAAMGVANGMASTWNSAFMNAGVSTSSFLVDKLHVFIDFDQVNEGAVAAMQANKLDLVREIVLEQRLATQQAILDGVRSGMNPKQVAISVRDSIGLTQHQQSAVANYRRLLENGDGAALQRALRDARFDSTVRAAVQGKTLTQAQIDRMVTRYSERYLDYRAKVISRTEAIRAANQGSHQMYIQAIDAGEIDEQSIERKWVAGRDARTRESHRAMQGQKRAFRESFRSGDGNSLLYPGDPSAPGSDTIQCRCAVTTRFKPPET